MPIDDFDTVVVDVPLPMPTPFSQRADTLDIYNPFETDTRTEIELSSADLEPVATSRVVTRQYSSPVFARAVMAAFEEE